MHYVVKSGDGWTVIYKKFEVCSDRIKEIPENKNSFDKKNEPKKGSTLIIPLKYSALEKYNPSTYKNYIQSDCKTTNEEEKLNNTVSTVSVTKPNTSTSVIKKTSSKVDPSSVKVDPSSSKKGTETAPAPIEKPVNINTTPSTETSNNKAEPPAPIIKTSEQNKNTDSENKSIINTNTNTESNTKTKQNKNKKQ